MAEYFRAAIGLARIFSMTFISHHLSYMVIYVIYCHQLPCCLICGGAPHQIQPNFCLTATKICLEKFFRHPGVMHPLQPLWLRLCEQPNLHTKKVKFPYNY